MRPNAIAKVILLLFSSVVLLGTFQNCAKSSGQAAFTPETASGSNTTGSDLAYGSMEKIENIDLSMADSIDLSLRSLYAEGTEGQRRSKELQLQNIKINLANGEMRYVSVDGEIISPVRLCLRHQELEEFKSILHSVRLCQPNSPSSREDIVCTQSYKYPFAWLQYASGEKIKLGEIAGCQRSIDLCDEHRDVFNGFVAYIRNHLDNRKCL